MVSWGWYWYQFKPVITYNCPCRRHGQGKKNHIDLNVKFFSMTFYFNTPLCLILAVAPCILILHGHVRVEASSTSQCLSVSKHPSVLANHDVQLFSPPQSALSWLSIDLVQKVFYLSIHYLLRSTLFRSIGERCIKCPVLMCRCTTLYFETSLTTK